jgi:hypothetical protein
MTKERVNMFWHGDKVSPLELACMQSFVANDHSLCVYTYAKTTLPSGVSNEDASKILPYESFFIYMNSPSAFSNIFRYQLLLRQGGWWADTDVLCLKDRLPSCDYYWAEQEPGILNGAVLKFPAGDPLCERLLVLSNKRARRIKRWGQLGPFLLTEVLSGRNLSRHSGTMEDAYPIHFLEAHYLWFPEYRDIVHKRADGATFLHMWHNVFGEMGINLFSTPPTGSYLADLYRTLEDTNIGDDYDDVATRMSVDKYMRQHWVQDRYERCLKRDIANLMIANVMSRPPDEKPTLSTLLRTLSRLLRSLSRRAGAAFGRLLY